MGHSAAANSQHRTFTICRSWLCDCHGSHCKQAQAAAGPCMICNASCAAGQPQEIDADHFHRTADLTLGELLQKVDRHLQQQGPGASMRVDMTEGVHHWHSVMQRLPLCTHDRLIL